MIRISLKKMTKCKALYCVDYLYYIIHYIVKELASKKLYLPVKLGCIRDMANKSIQFVNIMLRKLL